MGGGAGHPLAPDRPQARSGGTIAAARTEPVMGG